MLSLFRVVVLPIVGMSPVALIQSQEWFELVHQHSEFVLRPFPILHPLLPLLFKFGLIGGTGKQLMMDSCCHSIGRRT